jgi:hypothetical protein
MPDIKFRRLKYQKTEEHILRRLGGAVVTQWSALPSNVQKLLLGQATFMSDRYETVQLESQIRLFIQSNQDEGC